MVMALSKHDWLRAALFALAEGGTAAVAVEPLAAHLGASKGSFYWHFRNREDLIIQVLEDWERVTTHEVVAQVQSIIDPEQRFRRVMEIALGYQDDDAAGQAEIGLLASAHDPLVGPILRRVTDTRLDFLERCLRDMGFPAAAARHRARLAYSAFLGWYEQRRIAPHRTSTGRERARYQRAFLDLVLQGRPDDRRPA